MTATAKVIPLYEYPKHFERVYEQIAEGGGELTPELAAELGALQIGHAEKLQGCRDAYFNHKATLEAMQSEIKRLQEMASPHVRMMDWLKQYVRADLDAMEITKFPLHRGAVRIQQNSRPSISWPGDVETIPDEFRRVRVELDGDAAYRAWKADRLPDGFDVRRGDHVRLA